MTKLLPLILFLLSPVVHASSYGCDIVKDKNFLPEDFPAVCDVGSLFTGRKLSDEEMNPICDEALDWARTECVLAGYKTCNEVVRKKNVYREEVRDFGTRWPYYGCAVVVRGSRE